MKKQYRVKKNEEFQAIMKRKRFVTSKGFAMYIREKTDENSRIGISVSKKLGNAVVRNKVKRQIRMMCQEIYDFQEPYDTIILVRFGFMSHSFEENKNDLCSLHKKVKI